MLIDFSNFYISLSIKWKQTDSGKASNKPNHGCLCHNLKWGVFLFHSHHVSGYPSPLKFLIIIYLPFSNHFLITSLFALKEQLCKRFCSLIQKQSDQNRKACLSHAFLLQVSSFSKNVELNTVDPEIEGCWHCVLVMAFCRLHFSVLTKKARQGDGKIYFKKKLNFSLQEHFRYNTMECAIEKKLLLAVNSKFRRKF